MLYCYTLYNLKATASLFIDRLFAQKYYDINWDFSWILIVAPQIAVVDIFIENKMYFQTT